MPTKKHPRPLALRSDKDSLQKISDSLRVAQRVIVLAGAGISTSAGIPVSSHL